MSVLFIKRKQNEGESIESYPRALTDLGKQCKFRLLLKWAALGSVHQRRAADVQGDDVRRHGNTPTGKAALIYIDGRGRHHPRKFGWKGILEQTATINMAIFEHEKVQKAVQEGRQSTASTWELRLHQGTSKGKHLAKDCFAIKM